MSESPAAIIRLEKITKRFPGIIALDQVTLSIFPGEIHAVIGENGAGKSTLMNIVAGELQPDDGRIIFDGNTTLIPNPVVSRRLGISVVFQELALCPNLSIAENISLWRTSDLPPLAFLKRGLYKSTADEMLSSLGLTHFNVNQPVGQLSIAKQQMVEIAKAISTQARVLILDEPNSALTQEESDHLFAVIRNLRAAGVAIIYVSHHLQEVLDLADRITVLRDGQVVDTLPIGKATIGSLIASMVGRNIIAAERDFAGQASGEPALEVSNLSRAGAFQNVSFQVRAGELVGIAGLPDSYKDELVESLFGLGKIDNGDIYLNKKPARINGPADAIRQGMYLIPADRRGSGALLQMTLEDNIVASSLGMINQVGFIQKTKADALAKRYFEQLDIRATGISQLMANLSGGNQQKVILARGLATEPAVYVLHEPTRGIDVGAKAEIYKILQNLTAQGAAILIISSELPELISQCDRILVMYSGRINGVFRHNEVTEEDILACAMGHAEHFV